MANVLLLVISSFNPAIFVLEPQTRKLFKVCAMRHIPIFTFINKMDRETKDPLSLCERLWRVFP